MFVTWSQKKTSKLVAVLRAILNPSQTAQAATNTVKESRTHPEFYSRDVGTGILNAHYPFAISYKICCHWEAHFSSLGLFWGEQPPFTPIGCGGGNFLITLDLTCRRLVRRLGTNAVSNAIGYAMHYSRSADAVIRV